MSCRRRPLPPAPLPAVSSARPGVVNLVQKGVKKISPFFIPYAITNMGGALLAIDQARLPWVFGWWWWCWWWGQGMREQ